MEWHGADKKTAEYYNSIYALIVPIVGFPACLICGFVVKFDNKYSLFGVMMFQVILFLPALLPLSSTLSFSRFSPLLILSFRSFSLSFASLVSILLLLIRFQLLLAVALVLCAVLKGPLWVQYITFVLFIIWRMNSTSLCNAAMPVFFRGCHVGAPLGFLWTCGGALSLIIGQFLTKWVIHGEVSFFSFV
jgi:hypothetical protein